MKNDVIKLKNEIERLGPWYQNFDLDGVQTNLRDPAYPEVRWKLIEPHIPDDLKGATVLDLGCNAGWFAVKMKQRGADYVLGVDVRQRNIKQANLIADYYNLKIDYKQVNVYEFVLKNKRQFDYIIFLGLFYHLRYPLLVLDKVAEMTRKRCYFQTVIRGRSPIISDDSLLPQDKRPLIVKPDYPIIQNEIFQHPDYPGMFFIEEKYNTDDTNWWFCNETGIKAILRSSGFNNFQQVSTEVFVCEPLDNKTRSEKLMHENYVISRVPLLK
jgi:tRNA (mo5U34)-methyltransferase